MLTNNSQERIVDYLLQKDSLVRRIQSAQQVCMLAQIPFVYTQKTIQGLISNYNLSQSTIGGKIISAPFDISNARYPYFDNFFFRNTSLNWLIYHLRYWI